MKKFQIRTHGNKNLARAIQDKLYELGYSWAMYSKYNELGAPAYQVGVREDDEITWNEVTKDEWGEVITLDELFSMKPKETIKIGDQTYDKAEFEAATKNLTPLNK